MPSIYQLKPAFQNSLRPLVRGLASIGVTANQVTVFAMLLSFAAGAAIYFYPTESWPFWCIPIALLLRMALNAIDGMLAREHDMKSKLGAFLNEIGDVVSDAAMYLPFTVVAGVSSALVVINVLLAGITELAGVVAQVVGGERRYDGPVGKSDRAFLFGLLSISIAIDRWYWEWSGWLLGAMAVLQVVTVVKRVRGGLK